MALKTDFSRLSPPPVHFQLLMKHTLNFLWSTVKLAIVTLKCFQIPTCLFLENDRKCADQPLLSFCQLQPTGASLQGWRLHGLSGQPVAGVWSALQEVFFLKWTLKSSSLHFNLCPLQLERKRQLYSKFGRKKESIRLQ